MRKAREDIESLQNLGLNPGPEYLGFREASQRTINNIEDFKKSQAQAKKIQQAVSTNTHPFTCIASKQILVNLHLEWD